MENIHNNAFSFFHKFLQYISGLGVHTSSTYDVLVQTTYEKVTVRNKCKHLPSIGTITSREGRKYSLRTLHIIREIRLIHNAPHQSHLRMNKQK